MAPGWVEEHLDHIVHLACCPGAFASCLRGPVSLTGMVKAVG